VSDSENWSAPDDPANRPQDPPPYQQQPYQQQPYQQQQPGNQYYPQPQRQAPKPGVIPLRPLGLGEILDGAVTTIRTYPKQTLGVSALVGAVTSLVTTGIMLLIRTQTDLLVVHLARNPYNRSQLALQTGDTFRAAFVTIIPTLTISTLAHVFLSGILAVIVGKAVLGQPVTFGQAWQHVRPRVGRLLGLSALYTLMVVVGGVLLIAPGMWLYVMFSLASSVLVLEGTTVGRAFGRSRELVDRVWWRTFGILLVASLIAGIVAYVIELPLQLINGGLNELTGAGPVPNLALSVVLTILIQIIAQMITTPFTAAATTLVYVDRRMRREGMDIELTRQAGATR
jgi:hypothetical protein